MTTGNLPEISPEEASRNGAMVRDEDLAMLAAVWLAQGYDSEELRDLASLTCDESRAGGRRLLPGVLASLGWPVRALSGSPDELPWLGYWGQIAWAKVQMDRLLTPYAAAQQVIEVAGDVPDLWIPAGGERLMALLSDWDEYPAERDGINDQIRGHLRSLHEEDVPPLICGS